MQQDSLITHTLFERLLSYLAHSQILVISLYFALEKLSILPKSKHVYDKNNEQNKKIRETILPMLYCRCFVEISAISIILFSLSKVRKQRNAKRNIILTKITKICYDRPG